MNIRLWTITALTIGALALTACGQATSTRDAAVHPTVAPAQANETNSTLAPDTSVALPTKPLTETMAMDSDHGDAMATATTTQTMAMDSDHGAALAAETMTETMAMEHDDGAALATDPTTDTMATEKDTAAAVEAPAWFGVQLTDVITGQPLTIADHKGKVVLVETLAVWCSNCMKQQRQVLALHEALGKRDDFVSIGLDIDLNESPVQLKDHADRNGFDWVYAVATADVAREIGKLYGNQFLNPPSTPMLIVDRQGAVHLLPFGIKSAEELQEALKPFLNAEM